SLVFGSLLLLRQGTIAMPRHMRCLGLINRLLKFVARRQSYKKTTSIVALTMISLQRDSSDQRRVLF
ncbi:MAG: hypothetical protein ACPIOQ_21475, partial [Promethearchaeia archaeon]